MKRGFSGIPRLRCSNVLGVRMLCSDAHLHSQKIKKSRYATSLLRCLGIYRHGDTHSQKA